MTRVHFFPLMCALLAVLCVIQVVSIRQEAQTWDEGIHLAAGFSYWKTGDFRMNPEHPPLSKLLCAIPLLAMNVEMPRDQTAWKSADELNFGALFLYTNRIPADSILFPARCVTIVLTLILGLALALWTRARFGPTVALVALTFFAFDPNMIAHGRYVTTDLAVTLFSFLACIAWGHPVLAGICLGLALGSKFSAIFLLPVFAVFAIIRWPGARSIAVTMLSALLMLTAIYSGRLDIFGLGISQVFEHNSSGHVAYLFGQTSQTGWWYYFPAAFAVKWPVAVLLGIAWMAASVLWKRPRPGLSTLLMLIPLGIYFATCLVARIDIGVRHLLPLIPPLYVLLAVALVRYARPWLTTTLLTLLVVESSAVFPNYLAFFNMFAGGPSQGPRYLLDSNIDWGQDTKKLKSWLAAHGTNRVCRVYFGQAILAHYGIEEEVLPGTDDIDAIRNLDCYVAASVTPLYGLYVEKDHYRWLRNYNPVAKIGYSIYVYDLRKLGHPR